MPRSADPDALSVPTVTVTIGRVGGDGDGIAARPAGGPLYVPFTLPGESVRARPGERVGDGRRAELAEVLVASDQRVMPPCDLFGACGGCALQHWGDAGYADWKSGFLTRAVERAGFPNVTVAAMARTPAGARRRIELSLARDGGRVRVGLHRARSSAVVDMTVCTVLHPALVAVVAPLRALLGTTNLVRKTGSATLNLLDTGPDVLLRTDAAPDASSRAAMARMAASCGIPRMSWALGDGLVEPAVTLGAASVSLSGRVVTPPPGAFLQASAEGERAIVAAVMAGLPTRSAGKLRIADLYAGIGTLTFPLAEAGVVRAYEGEAAAAAALHESAGRAGLGGRIVVETRDLARRPVQGPELAKLDAVVLDPPHGGAADQVALLAAAGVPRVIYVSCNPAALARDAALLQAAGYAVLAATPIDQFLWSARLESVVVFDRPRRRTMASRFVP